MSEPILKVTNVSKLFPLKYTVVDAILRKPRQALKAVQHVSLSLEEGETLGLVGESGCGKSTLARTIINLYRPTEGTVQFNGNYLSKLSKKEQRERCTDIQMIFQDPYSSLNPRMTVRQVLAEVLKLHNVCKPEEIDDHIDHLLELVGLNQEHAERLPSAFSGGQRQRIGIARALAVHPKLIIADEPVSALDVSIQAQIINLLIDLKKSLGLSILFISHDLRVVRYISDRVAVMYLGSIVETAPTDILYDQPMHPYTQILLQAAPSMKENRTKETHTLVKGELPSPINLPSGCPFHPRCPKAMDICSRELPKLKVVDGKHQVACHLYEGTPVEEMLQNVQNALDNQEETVAEA